MDVQFACIWNQEATLYREKVVGLWNQFGAHKDEETVMQRSKEIVYTAIRNNEVIGVSTVRPKRVKSLNNNYFLEFRCFVSPQYRIPGLSMQLLVKTKEYFEADPNVSGYPCVGLIMVVENDELKSTRTKAILPYANAVFIGYTSQGHHVRVSYFKGARI